jgi:hypothetical protein
MVIIETIPQSRLKNQRNGHHYGRQVSVVRIKAGGFGSNGNFRRFTAVSDIVSTIGCHPDHERKSSQNQSPQLAIQDL